MFLQFCRHVFAFETQSGAGKYIYLTTWKSDNTKLNEPQQNISSTDKFTLS